MDRRSAVKAQVFCNPSLAMFQIPHSATPAPCALGDPTNHRWLLENLTGISGLETIPSHPRATRGRHRFTARPLVTTGRGVRSCDARPRAKMASVVAGRTKPLPQVTR